MELIIRDEIRDEDIEYRNAVEQLLRQGYAHFMKITTTLVGMIDPSGTPPTSQTKS